jgi:hypothetical protein
LRSLSYRHLLTALVVAVIGTIATVSYARMAQEQGPEWKPRIWVGGGGIGRFRREPPKWVTPASYDGSFNYCRAYFSANRREAGGSGWDTDFPGADNNFSVRLAELTMVHVKLDTVGQPDYVVVRLTDPLLFRCPMLHMEDAGVIRLSDDEVASLRAFLMKGGFLTVDDFWGTAAWNQFALAIGRVLPPGRYPIVDIPPDHPIMHTLYDVKEVEQVSNIRFWAQTGGNVSERGPDSPHANFRGIADERGRLMVVMTHNTDIPDTWEREGESKEYFDRFSPNGYAIGVNVVLYAMTH